jgi:hypothetical protein
MSGFGVKVDMRLRYGMSAFDQSRHSLASYPTLFGVLL